MNYKKIFSFLFMLIIIQASLKAEIPYSLDLLLNYNQKASGFVPTPFWDSMKRQRDETENAFVIDHDVKTVEQNFNHFCQEFVLLPKQDSCSLPKQFSIPPIIHLIWLGSSIPEKVSSCFDSWKKHHPAWEVKLWTDKELQNFHWSTPFVKEAFTEADTWAEKADILRIEVLNKFGGIYSDADVVCLQSFQDLIVQDIGFFSCFELNYVGKHYGEPFFVGSAVMGAQKNSSVMQYCLSHLRTKTIAPDVDIIKRTGPGLISRACQAILKTKEENILILPCSYLYPLPWKKRDVTRESVLENINPETLAIHLWDGSWCTHKKKKKNL